MPKRWRDRRVVLCFEGVNYHAKVWVNGRLAGSHDDAFLPFALPVHKLLKFGASNRVVVRVDAIDRPGELPGPRFTWQVGWRPDGGILRDVRLIAGDFLHMEGLRIVAEPETGGGSLSVKATVRNERPTAVEASVCAEIRDGKGAPLVRFTSAPLALKGGATAAVTLEGRVPGARPWSPSTPRLYDLAVRCRAGGRAADTVNRRVGFRRIETRGERLLLNGRPIFLTGFNRHEDSPRTGQAVDPETTRRDLVAMKRAGCNFIRLCHYPHDPGELDLCDELGLLAMDEVPLYNWPGHGEGKGASSISANSANAARSCVANAHHLKDTLGGRGRLRLAGRGRVEDG